MKIINKIFCFLSVLVLLVPLLCFNVIAEESDGTVLNDSVPYVGIDIFKSDNGSYMPSEYINSSGTCDLFMYNYSDRLSDIDSFRSKYAYSPNSDYLKYPYLEVRNYDGFSPHVSDSDYHYAYDFTNDYILFLNGLQSISSTSFSYFSPRFSFDSTKPFYFFCYSYTFGVDSDNYLAGMVSYSPFYFSKNSDNTISLVSDSDSYVYTFYSYALNNGSYITSYNLYNKSSSPLKFNNDFTQFLGFSSTPSSNYYCNQTNYKFNNAYTNCTLDTSMFDSGVSLEKGFSSLQPKTLSEQIDVKLTPEFGLDMDRIDPLTNQSDYFKFEIKNNSDSPVQWCAGIYDPQLITSDTVYIDSISAWGYVSRTTYYDFSCQEEKGIFRTTYTYSGTLKTGSFDYHYLEPGETFTDVIYWENIKISPNVIYHFFVNAVKTDLNHATLNIDPPVIEESSDMHSVTKIEESYYNTILNVGSAFRTLESNIFNVEFSCLSMPAFTTTVRSGNSVVNTSGTDRYKQYENFETVSDINGLDTKVNKDYVDPSILANLNNKSDVNVDFDNVGLDDVKNYISYSQDFFNLIKSVLGTFPAFVWVLICFGLTGLIVIAIIKALL